MSHDHSHDHDHPHAAAQDGHPHADHGDHDHPHASPHDHDSGPMSPYELLEVAVRELLIDKGVLTAAEIQAQMDLIDKGVEVRVHDSTADLRYIVLPARPAGTEGWSEDRLAALVTRDCMIGTAVPLAA